MSLRESTAWQIKLAGGRTFNVASDLKDALSQARGLGDLNAAGWHNPSLLYDMDEAKERIEWAVKKQEKILVYGDYDVDGVSGTAQMVLVLRALGAQVSPFLPDRMADGYGLNKLVLERMIDEFDLLISVDCGVSNVDEIAWLKQQGKEAIVIDHHTLPEGDLPPARAIIHPRHPRGKYPWPYLAAAGVAWKVCQRLVGDEAALGLLDLAVLGTVADMVPMRDENRVLTHFGLRELGRTRREGLKALMRQARLQGEVTADQIAWRMAPLMNAAGKVDHAQPALDLLLAGNEREAEMLVDQLEAANRLRRSLTTRIAREAEAQIDVQAPVVFAQNASWPAGVVGLAAGKLAEKYGRPAVIVGGNGRELVGSARSPQGVNVLDLLKMGEEQTLRLGGHARAAGFSLEESKVGDFKKALMQGAGASVFEANTREVKQADAVVAGGLLSWETLAMIEKMAPFGEENRKPLLVARGMELADFRPVGSDKRHAKCVLMMDGQPHQAIGFGLAEKVAACQGGVDAMFKLEANEWQGRRSLQLGLVDMVRTGEVEFVGE